VRGGSSAPKPRTKLSYKEPRELEALPGEIEALEAEQHALAAKMSSSEYYKQPADVLRADRVRGAEIERALMNKLERWAALEAVTRT
jgi:ABC transport system ATP-binding/permease protein